MKTPIQEMLEWVRATLPMDLDTPRLIEEKIESLLDKEEEQLCEHEPLHSATATLDYCPKCGLYQPSK
jgi:hypothetical protein